ncbi:MULTISPECIES: hypothetical protein [unclassified Clostridium]|uniref:hypothetical protein n=1 Tax=unclassified Clostridium TaxID=2614128 RepID=UPI00029754B0|nr:MULTISPECIES: hypothetical protein [unclassified Clostridium]EKQ54563.1 MAG: hypothetical protein A370_03113 [Clostridium sp. Maddingley MBC34-26]
MKKRKNNSNIPRHKRLKRSSRLEAARCWISKYDGQNLVKGYSKHFGVDKLCAVKELNFLGYKIKDEYVKQLERSFEEQVRINQNRKELRKKNSNITSYENYEDMFWDFEECLQDKNDEWCEEMPF